MGGEYEEANKGRRQRQRLGWRLSPLPPPVPTDWPRGWPQPSEEARWNRPAGCGESRPPPPTKRGEGSRGRKRRESRAFARPPASGPRPFPYFSPHHTAPSLLPHPEPSPGHAAEKQLLKRAQASRYPLWDGAVEVARFSNRALVTRKQSGGGPDSSSQHPLVPCRSFA